MFLFRPFVMSDLDKIDLLPYFEIDKKAMEEFSAMTIYDRETNDIYAILAVSKNPLCDSCECNPKMDVSFLSALLSKNLIGNAHSFIRYTRWVVDEIANVYDVDAFVVGADTENPLAEKFLRLVGFTEVEYPIYAIEGRRYKPFMKKINKKLAWCGKVCYLKPITN